MSEWCDSVSFDGHGLSRRALNFKSLKRCSMTQGYYFCTMCIFIINSVVLKGISPFLLLVEHEFVLDKSNVQGIKHAGLFIRL